MVVIQTQYKNRGLGHHLSTFFSRSVELSPAAEAGLSVALNLEEGVMRLVAGGCRNDSRFTGKAFLYLLIETRVILRLAVQARQATLWSIFTKSAHVIPGQRLSH